MNVQAAHAPDYTADIVDPLVTIMGNLPDDELKQRKRIRSCRDIASYRVTRSKSGHARSLLWMVCDCANGYVYAPVEIDQLTEAANLCRRLLMCADMAETLMEDSHEVE